MPKSIRAMIMSREQLIYLLFVMLDLIIGGAVSPTWASLNIGLGYRFYSVQMIVSCVIGMIYAVVSSDVQKKRWVFKHYKAIDLGETIFYTLFDAVFLVIYIAGCYNPNEDWNRVCKLFFSYSLLFQIARAIVQVILPGIGNVFEQSLYKNQIDYQNHSNAETLMANFGCLLGAAAAFLVGDTLKNHLWIVFALVINDWLGLWSRWQFYFNKKNYDIIKRNFAKDCAKWRSK